ncbi:MAG: hypothetical protein DCC63_14725 [Nitrospira sp.]|nr:MAG: hypothetical protein DCC63_14725 [Nitrospira sp.]
MGSNSMSEFSKVIDYIRDKLKQSLKEARSRSEATAKKLQAQGVSHDVYHLMRRTFLKEAERAVDQIVNKLGRPAGCTRAELGQILCDHLTVDEGDFDRAFERAFSLLNDVCGGKHYSEAFELITGPLHVPDTDELEPIWEFCSASAQGIVEVSGQRLNNEALGFLDEAYYVDNPTADGIEDTGVIPVRSKRLEARIRARCSSGAMEEIVGSIRHIAPSLFRCACSLEQFQRDQDFDSWASSHYAESKEISDADEEPDEAKEGPDPIVVFDKSGRLGIGFRWIHEALDACFVTGDFSKKDSMEKRVRNAAQLIAESDAQKNPAISLALSIAAVEAMLGSKGEPISHRLKEYVAALLEPDLSQRIHAEKFVADLYDRRSRTLHGETVDGEHESVRNARLLASAVLKAFVEAVGFGRRMEHPIGSPQELISTLQQSKYQAGQPTGIQESAVRGLWVATDEE